MPKMVIFVILLTLSLNSESISNRKYGSITVDEVTSIYDGDTFRVNINSYTPIVGDRIPYVLMV